MPGISGLPLYQIYRTAWIGLDWLYPPKCGGCGERIARWCSSCQNLTRLLPSKVCRICGSANEAGVCSRCIATIPGYQGLRSWAEYNGPLRKAVHRLKFYGDISLGEVLARPMIELLQSMDWPVELIVPVPMSTARRSKRGYNQAALLAIPIALYFKIPYRPKALTKVRETRSQVGLNPTQRMVNVRDAYKGREQHAKGKSVLVVDDVVTTGATMEVCTQALLDAHARSVYCITLARSGLEVDLTNV